MSDWRDDDAWRPVAYDPTLCDAADIPRKPTPHAELAQPPVWASLYEGRKIVVTWWRPFASPPHATMVAEDE